jgi:hypothetical protein
LSAAARSARFDSLSVIALAKRRNRAAFSSKVVRISMPGEAPRCLVAFRRWPAVTLFLVLVTASGAGEQPLAG